MRKRLSSYKEKLEQKLGFTLLELLVIISMIGVLSTVVLASLGESREKAKIALVQGQLEEFEKALSLLHADTGLYSGRYVNLNCDNQPPPVGPGNTFRIDDSTYGGLFITPSPVWPKWNGPYIGSVPLDPWGYPYVVDHRFNCQPEFYGCDTGSIITESVVYSCGPEWSSQGFAPTNDLATYQCDGMGVPLIVERLCI